MYKILKESKYHIYVRYYASTLSTMYADLKIPRSDFDDWAEGKFNATDYSKVKQTETARNNPDAIVATFKQNQQIWLLDYIAYRVNLFDYILQQDIAPEGITKEVIKNTLADSDILAQYKLKRIRATKAIKAKYNIKSAGYPYIIVKI
jgi:hypothetical protein